LAVLHKELKLKLSFSYHLYHLMWKGLDLLFPPACGGCGKLGARWCDTCQQSLALLPELVCDVCGEPQKMLGLCGKCKQSRPPYKALRSWVLFKDPMQTALHKLKYRRDIALGDALALPLAQYISTLDWDIEMLVPVPLSSKRFSERGYNQVAVIAHPLALIQQWNYAPNALKRTKHTRSQVGLNIAQRLENVQNAFIANHHFVNNKKILLMDDVATTGATLNAASRALMEAGARHVYALTAARAVSQRGLEIA
jgi:ComF family protein